MFLDEGLDLIHVVDLDGAKNGKPCNLSIVEMISSTGITVELGGGLRTIQHFREADNAGVTDFIIGSNLTEGSNVLREFSKEFSGRIVAGIDARHGLMATHGWEKNTTLTIEEVVRKIEILGFSRIIYTDINKDGTLAGPNMKQLKIMCETTDLPVIASGGISRVQDIQMVKTLGTAGVIIGRAFYEGKITIQDMILC
tara:strand:- start:35300 stop:35893 length:594 start_codon:yes stop_codon:yes gene_type:complete